MLLISTSGEQGDFITFVDQCIAEMVKNAAGRGSKATIQNREDAACQLRFQPTCKSLIVAEAMRGSDRQREAEAEGSSRLMPTNDQQQEMAAMQERAPRLLLTCTVRRTAARFLLLVLYSCLLKCFRRAGAAAGTALAYILTLLASQLHSLPHGSWCRLATTAAAGAPVAQLWNMHLGACVFIIVMSLPSSWLWWAPKFTEDKLLEELVRAEEWAKANLDVLRCREGDCFKAKLRQRESGDENRFYKFLANQKKKLEASTTLVARLAELDCMVMAPGDTGLHAAVPSAAPRNRKVRSPNDAGLSAQEEDRKRTKTEARGQTSYGSAGASNSDFPMIKDSMVRNMGAMGSAVSLSTSSESGQARSPSSAVSSVQQTICNWLKKNLQEAAEAEGPPRLKRASSSTKVTANPPLPTGSYDYFERQSGAWCGMHALNNLLGGQWVNQEACRIAANNVRGSLSGADSVDNHLDPVTGFLSIDVINLLGSANLGIHVEGKPTAWEVLRESHGARALINWNQTHWTVLEAWPPDAPTRWRHTNSIENGRSGLRYGRAH